MADVVMEAIELYEQKYGAAPKLEPSRLPSVRFVRIGSPVAMRFGTGVALVPLA